MSLIYYEPIQFQFSCLTEFNEYYFMYVTSKLKIYFNFVCLGWKNTWMMHSKLENNFLESKSILIENSFNLDVNSSNGIVSIPCYICKITQENHKSIIGLISLVSYQDVYSKIILHEKVNNSKVNNYINQFITEGILNNPILLFYKKFFVFQHYLTQITLGLNPISVQYINRVKYEIFPINNDKVKIKLQEYLQKMSKLYVADGHHRIQALSKIHTLSRIDFSQLYISFIVQENDLELRSFNRFIKRSDISFKTLINKLEKNYMINKVEKNAIDLKSNVYAYLNSTWYQLNLKQHINFKKSMKLPVVHIDRFIISVLKKHSLTDHNILYSPGTDCINSIIQFYEEHQCQLAVHIPKLSFLDLFNTSEDYCMLPPHSTCFTPKLPNDLFIQNMNFLNSYSKVIKK